MAIFMTNVHRSNWDSVQPINHKYDYDYGKILSATAQVVLSD